MSNTGELAAGQAHVLAEVLAYQDGATVSRTIKKNEKGTVTVFAFDKGQELSEHSAPFDAFVLVLDGHARITIGGEPVEAQTGELVVMPANVPHAVQAVERFKMLLIMIRG